MMYNFLVHAHSVVRWLVLIMLVLVVINSLIKWRKKSLFLKKDKSLTLIAVETVHIQFLIGIILFLISPKVIFSAESMRVDMLRFFLVEHSLLMLIAVVLVTAGYSLSKRVPSDPVRFRRIFIWFFVALILILLSIPWPWRNLGAGWI